MEIIFKVDERAPNPRWSLSCLKTAFSCPGSVTAGNSSQTSDGAAATVVMSSDKARQLGIKPMARFVAFATAGYLPEEMGLGPVYAIPKVLKIAGLKLEDIDVFELNEAFAAQALSSSRKPGLIRTRSTPTAVRWHWASIGCTGREADGDHSA